MSHWDLSSNGPTRPFSVMEKKYLMDLVHKHRQVLLDSNTDSATLRRKNERWNMVTAEFNSVKNHVARNSRQLKKAWNNIKHRRKILLEKERKCKLREAYLTSDTTFPVIEHSKKHFINCEQRRNGTNVDKKNLGNVLNSFIGESPEEISIEPDFITPESIPQSLQDDNSDGGESDGDLGHINSLSYEPQGTPRKICISSSEAFDLELRARLRKIEESTLHQREMHILALQQKRELHNLAIAQSKELHHLALLERKQLHALRIAELKNGLIMKDS